MDIGAAKMRDISLAFLAGSAVSFAFIYPSIPTPKERADCQTYKVAHKTVTSYVLKPPPAPVPDPVVIKEACPQVTKTDENDSKPELTNTDETQKPRRHRRYRHHRVRSYWR